ncbi:hypothetical protein PG985_016000 [Apiospora marii]|uniref:Uncharacterized protein n=1 Tax=Apiospora marii TaxID=335849 RepID=A0ABR1S3T4_9PEZI
MVNATSAARSHFTCLESWEDVAWDEIPPTEATTVSHEDMGKAVPGHPDVPVLGLEEGTDIRKEERPSAEGPATRNVFWKIPRTPRLHYENMRKRLSSRLTGH